MALTMQVKNAITRELTKRYRRATKKEKRRILDELVALTGYNRSYGAYRLRTWEQTITVSPCSGKTIVLRSDRRLKLTRHREPVYDEPVRSALETIWLLSDCLCGKRLVPYLREVVPILIRYQELTVDELTRQKLLKISAATIDRSLTQEKAKYQLKHNAGARPATSLLNQIPIKTFAEWTSQEPGFVEIDLVAHDGGNARGDYNQTLNVTDVATGWTETQAVKNKAQVWTFAALKDIRARLPFALRGIHSDNGSEFINDELLRYSQQEHLTFTRGRPYRKNDNCYVEEKNYSVVRRNVGYGRYQGEKDCRLLNELYQSLRPYTNYFLPVLKLKTKARIGSRVTRKYEPAKTPYRRALDSPVVTEADKQRLTTIYAQLNPAELRRELTRVQRRLLKQTRRDEANERDATVETESAFR
jgi:hypothetical protein